MSLNSNVAEPQQQSASLNLAEPRLAAPRRTRLIYDLVAPLYPISSRLFHARAHAQAVRSLKIEDGSRVLEVAMGSGEMFDRLIRSNRRGQSIGVDFSANMAARSQAKARQSFPDVQAHCPCADARQLPFPDHCFDSLVCCYLFELLTEPHIFEAMNEFHRVLRPGGRLVLISVGQNESTFNLLYTVATKVAPAFWGRQVSSTIPDLLREQSFEIESHSQVRQLFFQSSVIVARRRF